MRCRPFLAGLLFVITTRFACSAGNDTHPPDDTQGVTIYDPNLAYEGYTLISNSYSETAKLVDMEGTTVHNWTQQQGLPWRFVELLDNGRLAVIAKEREDDVEGIYLELDHTSQLLRDLDVPAHHDFARTLGGDTIVLCREYVTNDAVRPGGLRSDWLAQFDDANELVWEWHADEHAHKLAEFVPIEFPVEDEDWAHTNTVEVLPASPTGDADERFVAGHLLFSMSGLNTIGVIDPATGEIVWAWGPGELQQQHMPTMLGDGHLLVFDNGALRGWSRVIELDPLSGEIVWQYSADPPESFFTYTRGSAQRLPNGNTLIADSNNARLFEVTMGGEIVWEYRSGDLVDEDTPMPIYRTYRYSPEFVDSLW